MTGASRRSSTTLCARATASFRAATAPFRARATATGPATSSTTLSRARTGRATATLSASAALTGSPIRAACAGMLRVRVRRSVGRAA